MIPILIALGVFDDAPLPEPLPTPPERIIRLTRSGGFTVAGHVLDPANQLNYLLDLSALLEDGENFTTVSLAVLPASAALGFSIPSTGTYQARQVDDRHIAIWPTIDPAKVNAQTWAGQGAACSFEVTASTDSDPQRSWQQTVSIRMAQR
ncbi:hypothetical protein [Qipengyuania sp.]|uniref:hypothetical protein n=1 Tax=Qipengyuania sp. TaxID=2004515 RepID=UPI0035C82B3C